MKTRFPFEIVGGAALMLAMIYFLVSSMVHFEPSISGFKQAAKSIHITPEQIALNKKKEWTKQHLSELIKLDFNSNRRDLLVGGMFNIKARISNGTDFKLDKVRIEVRHVRGSGKVCEFGSIVINNIYPHNEKTATGDESTCGIDSQSRIVEIISQDLGLHFNCDN
jgi:hypothetical protein